MAALAALAALSPKTGSACGSCWRSMRRADCCWTCPSSKNLGKDAGKWCIRMFDDVWWCLVFALFRSCDLQVWSCLQYLGCQNSMNFTWFQELLPCSTHAFFLPTLCQVTKVCSYAATHFWISKTSWGVSLSKNLTMRRIENSKHILYIYILYIKTCWTEWAQLCAIASMSYLWTSLFLFLWQAKL